jgi:hypothetical protein
MTRKIAFVGAGQDYNTILPGRKGAILRFPVIYFGLPPDSFLAR